jgi:argininosuccinate synthase
MSENKIVLAFSGGLDTSFCVPWLKEKGYEVVTAFVDTGGVSDEERIYIQERALQLGAVEHVVLDAGDEVWQEVVVPMLWGGQWYQYQYPLLCSDRYVIVKKCLQLARQLGTGNFAHGCTGMGNDQVRFDLTVRALGDFNIVAPIRDIQQAGRAVRDFEMDYLRERGFPVRQKTATYTMNENLLGVTISGSEIDRWESPGPDTWHLCRPAAEWPAQALRSTLEFRRGVAVALDGEACEGPEMLARLNRAYGAYGVGRGMYTGDTTVGLKGRIVYEAPALHALQVAHRALEEAVSTRHQNSFKPQVAAKWVELVYQGFFYEPLKHDLEAYLESSQYTVNGEVTIETHGGNIYPVAVESPHILTSAGATYAQSADWSVEEAEGFIKLFGQSSSLWTKVNGGPRGDKA